MRLVLASASPRRREFLRQICREFEVVPSGIDETLDDEPTSDAIARLALRKARAVALRVASGAIILGADTVVVMTGHHSYVQADELRVRQWLGSRTRIVDWT